MTVWMSVALPRSLKDSLEQDLSNLDKFLDKLGPLSGQAREPPRLPHDPVGMRQQLQEELAEVRARLEPYMVEAHQQVGWNLEGLRQHLRERLTDLGQVGPGAGPSGAKPGDVLPLFLHCNPNQPWFTFFLSRQQQAWLRF